VPRLASASGEEEARRAMPDWFGSRPWWSQGTRPAVPLGRDVGEKGGSGKFPAAAKNSFAGGVLRSRRNRGSNRITRLGKHGTVFRFSFATSRTISLFIRSSDALRLWG